MVTVLAALGRPVAAQDKGDGTWKFGNLQQGYCITFLVSPEDAAGVLPSDAQPVRLDAMAKPTPVLARVLADQPEFGTWMPAAVCLFRFGRVDVAGREFVAPTGASEMIGIVSYQARVAVDQPSDGLAVSMVFTNDKRLAKITDSTQVPFRQIQTSFGKAAHGGDERHLLDFGKTSLTWDGHAASDSTVLSEPVRRAWVVNGRRDEPVLLQWQLRASTSRSMVGALVVEGKDKLAKVMRKSPIRYVGPVYQGGLAELSAIP
jgi:hypothetical protein